MFWGLWSQRERSNNYYKAFISGINDTHIEFILEYNNGLKQVYKRSDPVLIIDKEPEKWEISVNASVIAVHNPNMKEWYRTGTVMNTTTSEMGEFLVSVRFDNGDLRLVPLPQLRLVKRPRFCQVKHVIQGLWRILKHTADCIDVPTCMSVTLVIRLAHLRNLLFPCYFVVAL